MIHLFESGGEVPLAQLQENGDKIDSAVLVSFVDVIEKLNKDLENIDYDYLKAGFSYWAKHQDSLLNSSI